MKSYDDLIKEIKRRVSRGTCEDAQAVAFSAFGLAVQGRKKESAALLVSLIRARMAVEKNI